MLIRCPHCNNSFEATAAGKAGIVCPSCKETVPPDAAPGAVQAQGNTILLKEGSSLEGTTWIERPDDVEFKLPYKQKVYLDIIDGTKKGTVFEFLSGRVVIGRTDGDLIIDDINISKKHAVVETWSRDTYFIRDLASTNGTYINGQRVTSTKIKNGDIITVGNTKLKFRVVDL